MSVEKTPLVLPEGYYNAFTLEVKWEETQKSKETGTKDAWALKIKCAVITPSHFNEMIYTGFNFINPNAQAMDISKQQWKNFLLAINVPYFDFEPSVGLKEEYLPILLYKELRIKTGIKPYNGAMRTNVKGFFPVMTPTTVVRTISPPLVTSGIPYASSPLQSSPPSWATEETPFDDIPL